jgi:hypothetical protein
MSVTMAVHHALREESCWTATPDDPQLKDFLRWAHH